mgnify:CR=1 FL=1
MLCTDTSRSGSSSRAASGSSSTRRTYRRTGSRRRLEALARSFTGKRLSAVSAFDVLARRTRVLAEGELSPLAGGLSVKDKEKLEGEDAREGLAFAACELAIAC